MSNENRVSNILDNGYVRLSSMLAVLIFCTGTLIKGGEFITQDALWKQKTELTMEQRIEINARNERSIFEVGITAQKNEDDITTLMRSATDDRWRLRDMRSWVDKTKAKNPDWIPFPPDEINND